MSCFLKKFVNFFCFFFVSLFVPIPYVEVEHRFYSSKLSLYILRPPWTRLFICLNCILIAIYILRPHWTRLFTICLNCILLHVLIVCPVYDMPNTKKISVQHKLKKKISIAFQWIISFECLTEIFFSLVIKGQFLLHTPFEVVNKNFVILFISDLKFQVGLSCHIWQWPFYPICLSVS